MTEEEAIQLIQRIQQEEGDRVICSLSCVAYRKTIRHAVHLVHKPSQRAKRLIWPDEWESLKKAWDELR